MKKASKVYSEICSGVSRRGSNGPLLLYHITPVQREMINEYYHEVYEEAVRQGVPDEKECLKAAIRDGLWKESYFKDIETLKRNYNLMLKKKYEHASDENEIKQRNEILMEYKAKLEELFSLKERILDLSAESIARRAMLMKEIEVSFRCSEEDDIEDYVEAFEELHITHEDIEQVCIRPFFIETFAIIEKDEFNFFQRPAYKLTENQRLLLRYGRHFYEIYKTLDGNVENLKTPQEWIDAAIIKVNSEKTKAQNPRGQDPNQMFNNLHHKKK